MASGMSAARHSRIGLPLSQVSATAISSRCSSMRSAILLSTFARSAGGVVPQAGAAAWAASRAFSTSLAVDRATSVNTSPVTGEITSK